MITWRLWHSGRHPAGWALLLAALLAALLPLGAQAAPAGEEATALAVAPAGLDRAAGGVVLSSPEASRPLLGGLPPHAASPAASAVPLSPALPNAAVPAAGASAPLALLGAAPAILDIARQ